MLVAIEPWSAYSNSSAKGLSLKPIQGHVRHSGFNSDGFEDSFTKLGSIEIKRDRFFANGSSPGTNDLFSWHIKGKGSELFIQSNGEQFHWQSGSNEGSYELHNSKQELMMEGLRAVSYTSEGKKVLPLNLKKGDQVLVLQGQAKLEGHSLDEERSLVIQSSGDLKLRLSTRTCILVVSSS